MSPLRFASFLLALLAAPAFAQPGALSPRPCDLPGTDAAWVDSAGVACYTLAVPENRAASASRTLRLAVAVAEATGPNPAEPLLYLHGGPGIATLDNVARYLGSPAWRRLRERHALAFMDYRGTGQSEPAWCPELEEDVRAIDRESPPASVRASRMAEALRVCRAAMEAEGLDLAGYASADLAADAEALRQALGLPAWNVYGVSFGTHVALNLVRDHREGVRALILDSAFPPNAPYLDWLRPFAEGLDVVARACAAEPACAGRVPDVAAAFRAAVARLDAAPLDVPVDSTGRTDRVDGTDFAWSVWAALLNPRHIPLVPLAVESGAARDSVALTAWARRFINPDAFGSNASAQFYAVWCTEGRPRTPEQTEAAALAAHPELAGFLVPGLEDAVCDAWQPHRAPASAAEAVVSDVPTLVLTGAFDPVTRPADGHLAAATLSRAQVLDVPAASHAALHADACTRDLTAAFLDAPTEPLDAACLAERPPIRFVTEGALADALAPPLAFVGVTVIDVEAGARRPDQTVLVERGRIAVVGPAAEVAVPTGATVVDGAGRFLIPGLWDMHVHAVWDDSTWGYAPFFPLFVASGVTGVRDTWGDLALSRTLRGRMGAGDLPGPRFVVAGNLVDGPPPVWPGSVVVDTPAEGRAVVDSLAQAGAPFVKVYSLLPADAYFAIAERAREVGLPFAGHVPVTVRASEASDAGQRSMEHLYGVLEGCSAEEEAMIRETASWRRALAAGDSVEALRDFRRRRYSHLLRTQDDARCHALLARFATNETWQVPTLATLRGLRLRDDLQADPRLRFLPPALVSSWAEEVEGWDWETEYAMRAPRLAIVGAMARAGVPLLAGSDTPNPYALPGFGLHDELALLVEAGLSPLDALRAATWEPARYFDATDEMGSVAEGKLADLVLLDADPLEDIANTTRIRAVVLNGRLLDRPALDRLLDQAEEAAQSD